MTELDKFRLVSNKRFIIARLLFLLVGILVLGFLATVGVETLNLSLDLPTGFLMLFFVVIIILNLPLYFLISYIQLKPSRWKIFTLSYLQIIIDLISVTGLIFISGQPGPISASFFLIPIVEAVVLFDFLGPFIIALLSGFILNFFSFSVFTFGDNLFLNPGPVDIEANDVLFSASYSVVYLLVAVFLSFNYQFVRPLKIFQLYEKTANRQTNTSEQNQDTVWANSMNKKMETLNRLLYSKELELKLAKQQLAKLEQAKSKFIAVTTHQLRTPLSAIKWTFNMMIGQQLGPINDDQKTFLEKGYEGTQRMISIVNNLLNLDHVGVREGGLNFTDIKIDDLIENIVFEFENQLESKNINLTIKKPEREIPLIEADPSQIRMVIENFLDNSIKYTPKDGLVTLQIKDARINSVQESLEISIQDSGIGIPEIEQKKIFSKFFRASNAVAHEPDGTGIGLFIAKDIIERHHGTVWFESIEGKGTTFHLTLPLRQPISKAEEIEEEAVAPNFDLSGNK